MKKLTALLIAVIMTAGIMTGCGYGGSAGPDAVKVGSKDFTEQLILAQITIQALEANGIATEDRSNMSGSDTVRAALLNGELDIYWEYTGTAWYNLFGMDEEIRNPQELFERVREHDSANDIVWLDFAPLNNTYALVMSEELMNELGIFSYSDLGAFITANPGRLVLACDHEFTVRPDGRPGLVETYGMDFGSDIKTMDMGIVFMTLANGQADVGMVFATDGRIKANNLVLLKDDKNFFPIYNPAPNVRAEVLEAHPEIAGILAPIAAKLTNEVMQDLNLRVDSGEMEPNEVAAEWLRAEGFID